MALAPHHHPLRPEPPGHEQGLITGLPGIGFGLHAHGVDLAAPSIASRQHGVGPSGGLQPFGQEQGERRLARPSGAEVADGHHRHGDAGGPLRVGIEAAVPGAHDHPIQGGQWGGQMAQNGHESECPTKPPRGHAD